jgi:hypothetical protein
VIEDALRELVASGEVEVRIDPLTGERSYRKRPQPAGERA